MSQSLLSRIARSTSSALVGAAFLASMLMTANAAHAQGLYQPPSLNTAVGLTPAGVASADFARSGWRSLAVVTNNNGSRTGGSLKVYLGTSATPTFANPTTYTTCKNPTAVLATDLNSDGYPDIAVACPTSGTVDIFFNNGAGGFGGANAYTATDPVAIVAGNFRGIGQIDLAVANGTGGITYLKNDDNNETFATSTVTAAGTLSGIAAGDFNHDGILDLAVSDSASDNVHVLTGTGTGTFDTEVSYSAGAHTTGIQTADFNLDGYLDLAVTTSGNNVSILNGSPTGFALYSTQAAGTDPIALSVTDVNSDGAPDVVAYDAQTASSTAVGAVAILLGNGNGTLQTAQISTLSAVPGAFAAVDDFNRDGKPDLAIIQSSDVVSLLLNNTLPTAYPDGRSYAAYSPVAAGNGNMADGIATGDFNRDGQLDVAVSYLQDDAVRVLLNNGGAFTLKETDAVGNQPYSVTSGDLNGDGYPDLVTANTTDGTVSVLLSYGNNPSPTGKLFETAVPYPVGKQPYQVAIGDLNGDGYPDLAVTNQGGNTVSILYGSKTGTFTAGPTLTTGASPFGVAIGDFKHDGYPDVAVTCFGIDMLYIFPNNKNGTFGTPYMYATGAGPMTLVTGDFNRDGKLDLVVANATGGPAGDTNPVTSGNNISFFAGEGNSQFLAGVIGPSLNFPDVIAAGDINGDGILDIVGVAPNYNSVEVTLGAGDGTFGTIQQRAAGEFTAEKQPWALALGDFNDDGKLDIVTANTYNQVNIAPPSYQYRYMTEYQPVLPGGVPSVDLLLNASAANIGLTISPDTFPLPAKNGGVTLTATVSPALSGPTPTGSVGFENSAGVPVGASPYTLNDGSASYSTGQLGSGQHLFTTLYSGDPNFQPTTSSGTAFAVTVTGTPVTLTLSSNSVVYGNTDTATVTVTGTGAAPTGTVTIYGAPGNFQLAPITLNGGTGQETFTVDNPDFNVGTYQLYAYYTPANGSPYPAGSSSDVQLQVTPDPTSITNYCLDIIFINGCQATVTPTYGTPYTPSDVSFSVSPGGATNEPIDAGGTADFPYTFPPATPPATVINYTVVASYIPPNGNYLASSATATVTCTTYDVLGLVFTICDGGGSGDIARPVSLPLTSFAGFGFDKSSSSRTDQARQAQSFSRFQMF